MNNSPLKTGLYLVSTPIGNLEDITLRALRVLKACDEIYCEDTRVSQKLLTYYGIKKPLFSYHEHNSDKVLPILLEKLKTKTLTLISDAGTPLISDPGYKLIQACYDHNFFVTAIPGPCALITAVTLGGISPNEFFFAGFVNKKRFPVLQAINSTLIFFESNHKLLRTLKIMKEWFNNRSVVVLRELTKIFEERLFGTFDDMIAHFELKPPKGEIILLLSPPHKKEENNTKTIESELIKLLETKSLKESVLSLSNQLKISKNLIYRIALSIER